MPSLMPTGKQQFFIPGTATPLVGGKLYTYAAGTSTPKTTWQDAAGTIANTNPITLDSTGSALVFWTGNYKILLKDSLGNTVYTLDNYNTDQAAAFQAQIAQPSGASLYGFIQAGNGAVARTGQDKHRDHVHIRDFGAVCDGVTDDTAAITAALAAGVEIWIDGTPLITSTVTVPAHKKIRFKGGLGNTQNSYPTSYLIKAAAMTTTGLKLLDCAVVEGGGLVCQGGNTGDGVALAGNSSKLSHFLVHGAGGVGVRAGTDAGDNSNSIHLDHVTSQWNSSHGIYVHDGSGSDCNAVILIHPFVQHNGGDGIRLGHTYWTTVINGLSELNTGWGLYLSGNNNATYPECRWSTVVGGDYNEGNTAGVMFDASYFSTIINPDASQVPSTAPNGLQGSAWRTVLGGQKTAAPSFAASVYQSTFRTAGSTDSPIAIGVSGTGSIGDGGGLTFQLSNSGVWHDAAKVRSWAAGTSDALEFLANNAGTMTSIAKMSTYYNGITPSADNTFNTGHPALRWATVYAGTATINTSDSREKQQIQDIEAAALRAVQRIPFKQFKFNDAVEAKGDGARWHFGVLAQDVKAAFEAEGLDPFAYGVLCFDEWGDMFEPVLAERQVLGPDGKPQMNPDGSPVMEMYDTGEKLHTQVAGNRYGVRHDELYALKLAAIEAAAT